MDGTGRGFKSARKENFENTLPFAELPPPMLFLGRSSGTRVGRRSPLTASCLCWRCTPMRRRQICTVHHIWVSPTVLALSAPKAFRLQRQESDGLRDGLSSLAFLAVAETGTLPLPWASQGKVLMTGECVVRGTHQGNQSSHGGPHNATPSNS